MKDLLNQKIVLYAGIALIIIGIAGLVRNDPATTDTSEQVETTVSQRLDVEVSSNDNGTIVSYQGIAGEDALSLLKAGAEVVTEDSTLGEYVVAINGVSQTDTEYWLLYIDDRPSSVGAAEYISQGGESIEWRLEN